jgi:hypothetical protein
MTEHEQALLATVPWDVASSYLVLHDVLSLRLASSQMAMFLSDSAGYDQCSEWLHGELMRRNVYVFNDVHNWRHARRAPSAVVKRGGRQGQDDDDDDEDSNYCLLSWLVRSSSSSNNAMTTNATGERRCAHLHSPFSLLLRCLRVIQHLPQQLTVAYSGKYGRHCWGLAPGGSSVVRHADCHRKTEGRGGCATCRTRIETVPMATAQEAAADFPNAPNNLTIDQTLCIPVGAPKHSSHKGSPSSPSENDAPKRRVRLDRYHNKCIPNVPSDLVCPCCLVSDRRTLVLTEMSYRTEPGTERISPSNRSLTFTPAAAAAPGEEDAQGDKKKRRRLDEGYETGSESAPPGDPFPPMYRESFFYNHFEEPAMDVKHAISLHCAGCGTFGVLSPAYLRAAAPGPDAATGNVMFSSAILQRAAPRWSW